MKSASCLIAAAALTMLLVAVTAGATPIGPTLTLNDGTHVVTVQDDSPLDAIKIPGIVSFAGPIGNWFLSLSTGFSDVGGGGVPYMHLNSVDTTLSGTGTLMITLSDYIGTSWSGPGAMVSAGGTFGRSGDTASFMTMINGKDVSTMNFDTSTGLGFSGNAAFSYAPTGNDLVELCSTIFHPGGGVNISSFDYQITPVPEPSTLLLLSAAGFALAVYGKRRAYRRI